MPPICELMELGYFIMDMGQEYHDEMWAGQFRWENKVTGEIQIGDSFKSPEAAWAGCQLHVANLEATEEVS